MKKTYIVKHGDKYYEFTRIKYREKIDLTTLVAGVLTVAQVAAAALVGINQIRKSCINASERRKRRVYKFDKRTGALILRGIKHQRATRAVKRKPINPFKGSK